MFTPVLIAELPITLFTTELQLVQVGLLHPTQICYPQILSARGTWRHFEFLSNFVGAWHTDEGFTCFALFQ